MKTLFTFLALVAWYATYAQTCLPEGIYFSSQTQIDDFPTGYPGCTQVLGDVTIEEIVSDNITTLDSLSVLTSIGGYLRVWNNAALTSLSGLNDVTSIGGDLVVWHNATLPSLSGLDNVTSIGGYLWVSNNAALTSLSGLDNVTSIGGYLRVEFNAALTSLSGLDKIDYLTITDLFLQNSSNLSFCGVKSICDYLDNDGIASISNNVKGCNSVAEVLTSCTAVPVLNVVVGKDEMGVYPNPTTGMLEITSGKSGQTITIKSVTDLTGRLVQGQGIKRNRSVNLANQPKGMYFITIQNGRQTVVKRIVKE